MHLLMVVLLSRTYYSQDIPQSVFNVDIVPPPEVVRRMPEQTIPPPVIKRRLPDAKIKPQPPITGISPETIYGEEDSKKREEDVQASEYSDSEAPDEKKSDDTSMNSFFLSRESSSYNRDKVREREKDLLDEKDVIPFDTSDLKYRGYMKMLKEQIESIWQYPEKASLLGVSGDLDIRFVINKDGRLGDVEIIRPSGFRELDEAAVKAINDAFPFWPLPDDWEGDEYVVEGHFVYVIGGVYVF